LVINKDGYAFTREKDGDRLGRKNLQPTIGSDCLGVDINRNFGSHWSDNGASNRQCDDNYHGSKPYSSNEAKHLRSYVTSLDNVVSYFDIHAYS
jgi:hypothetical protein